jgi:hypothetical protein
MVSKAISTTMIPVVTNTIQPIFMRYAKSCNHSFMKYHASGDAMINAIITSFKKSLDNKLMMFEIEAPNTFRIPISFVRFIAANAARPNNPRQARNIDIPPAHPTILLQRS